MNRRGILALIGFMPFASVVHGRTQTSVIKEISKGTPPAGLQSPVKVRWMTVEEIRQKNVLLTGSGMMASAENDWSDKSALSSVG